MGYDGKITTLLYLLSVSCQAVENVGPFRFWLPHVKNVL